MTDTITLPRAAEQVRKALELALESQFTPDDVECEHGMHYRDCSNNVCVMRDCKAALAALDAALAEPEPVHPLAMSSAHRLETAYSRIVAGEVEAEVLTEALGARGWVKREPATREQMFAAYNAQASGPQKPTTAFYCDGWQAAERFHGITKEDKT